MVHGAYKKSLLQYVPGASSKCFRGCDQDGLPYLVDLPESQKILDSSINCLNFFIKGQDGDIISQMNSY